ncbi:MAG: hypothetical protein OEY91_13295 [Nitrospirota bacterium]|nr:hypothetical protein [Nitrospirota bacterium]
MGRCSYHSISWVRAFILVGSLLSLGACPALGTVFHVTPQDDYQAVVSSLQPGDTLVLSAGVYDTSPPGLPIFSLHGEADNPIVITGPEQEPFPVLLGRSTHNTVRFDDASYIVVRNIEINGQDLGGDGVKAQGVAHHITLENLRISGVGSEQGTVGISTNGGTTWNWVIRNNVIVNAGTGMYLGNSPGTEPFIHGLIEHNLIVDTIGYNFQIKHQNPRPDIPGIPVDPGSTIIRHNVLSKATNPSTGGSARPNLLVGHFPLSGPGQDDVYEIYGNFFYHNPSGEALFQGEGNVALYNNLFMNTVGEAIRIQPHNDIPRKIRVFHNTIVARDSGIVISGGAANQRQVVVGNAVFAGSPIRGGEQLDNRTDTFESAGAYVQNPFATPGAGLDLYPKVGTLQGNGVDTTSFGNQFDEWDRDFNGVQRSGVFRGAYAGEGANPGWLPQLTRKPLIEAPPLLSLDIDSNGEANVWDASMICRYLDPAMTNPADVTIGLIDLAGSRTTPQAIVDYLTLAEQEGMLDADGNGTSDAFDCEIITAFLFGITSDSLLANGLGAGATRTTASALVDFLSGYLPGMGGEASTAQIMPLSSETEIEASSSALTFEPTETLVVEEPTAGPTTDAGIALAPPSRGNKKGHFKRAEQAREGRPH